MTTESTPIDGEVLDSMPATQHPAKTTALAVTDNPYMAMAMKAMEMGQVDQLDKLLDLQMKWSAEAARKAFVGAMSDFKAEPVTIAKTKLVSFSGTSYSHAELHDVTHALVPLMAKHGLSHRWKLTQSGKEITVECVISHRDGHSESVSMTAPPDDSGKKNTIQQIASTKTYLERYTLLAATGVATGGELDDDGRSYGKEPAKQVEYITDEQAATLQDLIDAYVKNKGQFMTWLRWCVQNNELESVTQIPGEKYQEVHDALRDMRNARTKEVGSAS